MPALSQVMSVIEQVAPTKLQEEWDNCGLAVGDPSARVRKVALALDATYDAIRFASRRKAALLLVHHPVFLHPPKTIREDRYPGSILAQAVRTPVAIYCAHTSFDAARGGLNDELCARLGLERVAPLAPSSRDGYCKLITFVPNDHAEAVAEAIFQAGGGVIGDYNHCSFRNPGTGSFLPLEGANPFSGTKGRVSYEPEFRLEVRVPRGRLDAAVAAMVAAHPYDEAAYDVYPLSGGDRWGLGRLAELPESMSLKEFAERCRRALRLRAVRFVGGARRRIRKVAVCTGSGNGLLTGAVSAGASAFVTGDVTYHAARDAEREGLALVDVGHFGSEHIFIGAMKKQLIRRFRQAGLSVEIIAFRGERDPFHTLQGG